jgi:UDPglucose--hexose-1-phosphate uridylyltransferase
MNEFREDPVSGDWVIIAPGRAKRPDQMIKKREARKRSPKRDCPFEDLKRSENWPPIATYPSPLKSPAAWKIAVIHNKYPALTHIEGCSIDIPYGMYRAKSGIGDHEIVITRDHRKGFADLSPALAAELFRVFQARHRTLGSDPCNRYVNTFCNWGREAGASLSHPHYQILAMPIVPPHAARSLHGAERYSKEYNRCVRCDIIATERKAKKRMIAENGSAIAFAPYAGKRPFEVSILPKKHSPYFSDISPAALADIAALLQSVLRRMRKYLHDPDLNFFIHDAPSNPRRYSYHHLHIEIVPVNVVSPPGGFEVSTVVNINVVDPEVAAAVLRGGHIT